MRNRWLPYIYLTRLNRPIGILLLLWPTLWGLWIAAQGWPGLSYLLVFVAGVVLMRSAGCIINDYADRNIDLHVSRTRDRPLAKHTVKTTDALKLFFILSVLAFALVLWLNPLVIALAVIAMILAVVYPFSKRFFRAPQLLLGVTFSWGIPMAFAAIEHRVPWLAWLLYTATIIWVVMYDTEYAMVDRDDDVRLSIHSTALLFGKADRLILGILQLIFLSLMGLIGLHLRFTGSYYLGMVIAAGLFAYQQRLLRHRHPALCFKAFLNNNWVGLVIFISIVSQYCSTLR